MAGEDENTCQQFIKKFIFMMIIFFLIVLMVAGFTVAIIFTLKKKANTCTRTCMEGEKCTCPKCTSRCNSETLYTNPSLLLDNEKLGSDCGCENYSELDYRDNIISSENLAVPTFTLSAIGTDMQTVTIGAVLKPIVYNTKNMTGASVSVSVSGLPNGVSWVFKNNQVNITGKPSIVGKFGYKVTVTGSNIITTEKSGIINVVPKPTKII